MHFCIKSILATRTFCRTKCSARKIKTQHQVEKNIGPFLHQANKKKRKYEKIIYCKTTPFIGIKSTPNSLPHSK
jgi:hypothetical protein